MAARRKSHLERHLEWAEKRSASRYENQVLDEDFDGPAEDTDSYERMVFGAFDGDMRGRPERGPSGMNRACYARKKRPTTSTEDRVLQLPIDAPPGWARP